MDNDPKFWEKSSDDALFWEWLQNKEKPAHKEEQPRLELPVPPPHVSDSEEETDRVRRVPSRRGVCIIEIV